MSRCYLLIVASNASWYPFGKPGSFLFGENRPVSACWGEPQIPHNAPLVRLRILRTLLFYAQLTLYHDKKATIAHLF